MRSSGREKSLRILAHFFGEGLQELVHSRTQLIHQVLDFFLTRATLERLTQRLLRLPQCLLSL